MQNSLVAPSNSLGYSRMYLDFLAGEKSARQLYLSPDLKQVASRLSEQSFERDRMADILTRQNRAFGASQETLNRIDKLRQPDAVCVFSGQQACLFGGPLLVILKALAITKAARLYEKQLGVPVLPIFWIAGDDHDFEEANHTFVADRNSQPILISYSSRPPLSLPTSEIMFEDEAELHRAKQQLKETLGTTDFTGDLYDLIERSYTAEDTFVSAFGKLMTGLTSGLGTLFFNPGDTEVKELATGLFRNILSRQDDLHRIVSDTNQSILDLGYHVQVEKKESAADLFYNLEGRTPIMRDGSRFRVGDRTFSAEELSDCMQRHPQRFSPDVMTRPLMQSYLFPVLSQKGGPSEIAYLAQINPMFNLFDLIPPVHRARASATIVEKRFGRMMEEFNISFEDLTGDIETVINRVMEKSFPDDLEKKLAALRRQVGDSFNDFGTETLKFDKALEKFAEQIRGKIDFNLNQLGNKLFASHKKKSQQTRDRIYRLWHSLYPNRGLQERSLNVSYFISRYGMDFVQGLYKALDSEEPAHQLINLSDLEE